MIMDVEPPIKLSIPKSADIHRYRVTVTYEMEIEAVDIFKASTIALSEISATKSRSDSHLNIHHEAQRIDQ